MVFIPDGTYYVDGTLVYTGAPYEYFRGVRLIGQSRSNTVIRLIDNCPGFGAGANRPVLAFDSPEQTFNNWQGHNMLRNLTVDVGSGNPGAIGVDFFSPNSGRIDNITIRSQGGTNNYAGAVGLNCRIGIVHGYFSNLTIDGFDIGIQLVPYHHCHPTIEHVTLSHQKAAAIKAVDGGASFRDVLSTQDRPDPGADALGLLIDSGSSTSAGAHVVLIDSLLVSARSPATTNPAIRLVSNSGATGHLFARNVHIGGYSNGVAKGGVTTVPSHVTEYVSDAAVRFDTNSPVRTMALPVEDVPFVPWDTDTNHWASPDDYGAIGDGVTDDTAAVQAALSSGKPVIYFPKQVYLITNIVTVPATVRRIDLMATAFVGSPSYYFNVNAASTNVLLIHDINDAPVPLARLAANRVLIFDSNRQSNLRNATTAKQKIFVNNGNGFLRTGALTALTNMTAWCRFINTEDKVNPNWTVKTGGVMWVLGYKCEGVTVNFKVQDGGVLEVLGGIANQFGGQDQPTWDAFNTRANPNDAVIVNTNGHLSFVGCTDGPVNLTGFENLVGDRQGSVTVMTVKSNLPPRTGRAYQAVVPLYNSYDAKQVILAATTFSNYLATFGLNALATNAFVADPDRDGLANWLEYLLGTDPSAFHADEQIQIEKLPVGSSNPTTLQFTFTRLIAAATVPLAVIGSSDLGAWSDVVDGLDGVTVTTQPLDQTRQQVSVTVPISQARRFLRLQADSP